MQTWPGQSAPASHSCPVQPLAETSQSSSLAQTKPPPDGAAQRPERHSQSVRQSAVLLQCSWHKRRLPPALPPSSRPQRPGAQASAREIGSASNKHLQHERNIGPPRTTRSIITDRRPAVQGAGSGAHTQLVAGCWRVAAAHVAAVLHAHWPSWQRSRPGPAQSTSCAQLQTPPRQSCPPAGLPWHESTGSGWHSHLPLVWLQTGCCGDRQSASVAHGLVQTVSWQRKPAAPHTVTSAPATSSRVSSCCCR